MITPAFRRFEFEVEAEQFAVLGVFFGAFRLVFAAAMRRGEEHVPGEFFAAAAACSP